MALSKDASKLLKHTVKVYRKRMKIHAKDPTWFRANIIKPQTENHEPSDRKNGRRVNY